MKTKIGFISLGCPKNQVDSELMLAKITAEPDLEITDLPYEADVIIINTCAFIEDAKKEAIQNILEMADLKKDGQVKKILVTGCLAQRYREEILNEMPEVDGVIGIGANENIVDYIRRALKDEKVAQFPPREAQPLGGERVLTTPEYWAYLRIADGCSNCCSYCVIPAIRGPFRSRKKEDIIKEAQTLASRGVKELIVIAQDVTRYGLDLYNKLALPELLRELCRIDGVQWIRLLYCYPDKITDELLDVMAAEEKILNYIDLPLQHADADVLKRMNRTGDPASLLALIEKIRKKLPGCILRTTLITGFPGETEAQFETLAKFTEDAQFDRLGCFSYSAEDGTPAAKMPDQIDEDVKVRRGEIIMEAQYDIFQYKQKQLIDTVQPTIVEEYDPYTDSYTGRTWMDAPEIDSVIRFTSRKELNDGDIVNVRVFDVQDYDLLGEAED